MHPPSQPFRAPVALSRRGLLVGAAAAALSGCTSGLKVRRGPRRPASDPAPDRAAETDPDVALAASALSAERAVLALVEATGDRHVRLRGALQPAAEAHRAHIQLLADAVPDDTATDTPAPADVRVPRSAARALSAVVTAEDELSAGSRRHAFAAQSGPFARLLASMAASTGQHAAVLGGLSVRGRQR